MSESKPVPRVLLPLRSLSAVGREMWTCTDCETSFSAVTPQALSAAFNDHVAYVNAVLDRATDVHFAQQRLDALIES